MVTVVEKAGMRAGKSLSNQLATVPFKSRQCTSAVQPGRRELESTLKSKFDLPAGWWPNLGLATAALARQHFWAIVVF